MKTLFLSLNKDYILDSAGNNIVLKYDLLNDILYELGAELAFTVRDDSISDKTKIITDIRNARPEAFAEIDDKIKTLVIEKLLQPEIPEETTIVLPDSYVDWLLYNSNQSYAAIGRKLRGTGNRVTLYLTDIYDEYIIGKFLVKVRDIVVANTEIERFTIVGHDDPESKIVKTIIDMRANLGFEPYNGGWLQCEIGRAFYAGIGVVKNLEESFKHYLQSAEKRNPAAANWVGWCYQQGLGIPSDLVKALVWYNIGAELKNHSAEANAAFFYGNGMGTSVDYGKAVELYERALANNNNIGFALNNLAYIYYEGKLGTPDYAKSFSLFERAAMTDGTPVKCAYMAGYMLYNGQGVEKNDKEALKYLERASKEGVLEAHFLSGKLHAEGAGTDFGTPDLESAKTAFCRGRDIGDDKCALELARIYLRQGDASPSDIISNLKFAADKDNHDAIFELAKYLHDNKDAGADIRESSSPITLLTKLVANNYSGAEELRARYQKEIDDENARIEAIRRHENKERKRRFENEEEVLNKLQKQRPNNDARSYDASMRYVRIKQALCTLVYRGDGDPNEEIKILVNEARMGDPLSKAILGYILLQKDSSNNNAKEMLLSSIDPFSTKLSRNCIWVILGYSEFKHSCVRPTCYALVAWMYAFGKGVKKNIYKAARYLKISIGEVEDPDNPNFSISTESKRSPFGLYLLGLFYYQGLGVPKDFMKASEYLSEAIKDDENIAKAYYYLALIGAHASFEDKIKLSSAYGLSNEGIEKRYLDAAKLNDSWACCAYGKILIDKEENTPAEEWLQKAIKYSDGDITIIQTAQQYLQSIGGQITEYKARLEIPVYFDKVGPTLEKPKVAPFPKAKAVPSSIIEKPKESLNNDGPDSTLDQPKEVSISEVKIAPNTSIEEPKKSKTISIPPQSSTGGGIISESDIENMCKAIEDMFKETGVEIKKEKGAEIEIKEKKGGLFSRLFGKKK